MNNTNGTDNQQTAQNGTTDLNAAKEAIEAAKRTTNQDTSKENGTDSGDNDEGNKPIILAEEDENVDPLTTDNTAGSGSSNRNPDEGNSVGGYGSEPTTFTTQAKRTYGCVISPVGDRRILWSDISLCIKEATNQYTDDRVLRLKAQAVATEINRDRQRLIGNEVEIGIIITGVKIAGVPGRTIILYGWINDLEDTPNRENGGLSPNDRIGWRKTTQLKIVFDYIDQIGQVVKYGNAGESYILPDTAASRALTMAPPIPV